MKVEIFKDSAELSQGLALRLAQKLASCKNVGFATGKTMEPIYEKLRQLAPFDIRANGWILDEYLGLSSEHPQSYRYFLNKLVFNPLGFRSEQVCFPLLEGHSIEEAVELYESSFQAHGGLDLQLLGLGLNGHVGLNEPGSSMRDRTRIVDIAESTRQANSIYFNDLSEVPKQAMTFGLANLLENKELWLIVTGLKKAQIVKRVIEGETSEEVPATLLKGHSHLYIFLDEEAASLLKPIT